MTGFQYIFLVIQTLVSGALALVAGFYGGIIVMRQTGITAPTLHLGPIYLAGDWPPAVLGVILCLVAMVSSFRGYRRRISKKNQQQDGTQDL
jgi:membrane protein implicated in regulation of membrane protease activity